MRGFAWLSEENSTWISIRMDYRSRFHPVELLVNPTSASRVAELFGEVFDLAQQWVNV